MYHNPHLSLEIYANLYKKGNKRDFDVEFADVSDGVTVTEMKVNGKKINTSSSLLN